MSKLIRLAKILIRYAHYFTKGGVCHARLLGVSVGEHCRIYTRNFGSEPFLIKIGNHCTITTGVHFLTHDGTGSLIKDKKGRRYAYSRIEIGDNVMIGVNSIIMPGVKVGSNVVVAAGSVVTKSVPDNFIVAGVPAKKIDDFNRFKDLALAKWTRESEMNMNVGYRKRVELVCNSDFKEFLKG